MPTFVFVRAWCLPALNEASAQHINPHPAFSIFRGPAGIPLIAEREIAGARQVEADATAATEARHRAEAGQAKRSAKDAARRAATPGEHITIPAGAFAGMSGLIESSTRKEAWVNFGGGFRMKIDTWLLGTDVVQGLSHAA